VRKGEHDGYYVINDRIQATFEHPFLVRRGDQWGFASANLLEIGDLLVLPDLGEERVRSIDARPGVVRTVSIHVPRTNTYLAGGVWVHNAPTLETQGSSSGSGSSTAASSDMSDSSGSGKSGGSSWNSGDSGSAPSVSVWSQNSDTYQSGGGGGLSGGGVDSGGGGLGGGGWGEWGNGKG
jgi:hypothetical protein